MKCSDFLSAATSSLEPQEKEERGWLVWIIRDSGGSKIIECERFFSLGRGNMPNVTLGTKQDVRRKNSFIAY